MVTTIGRSRVVCFGAQTLDAGKAVHAFVHEDVDEDDVAGGAADHPHRLAEVERRHRLNFDADGREHALNEANEDDVVIEHADSV